MHKTFRNVLHHGNNSVKIIIACSNLLNLGFLVCFVFSWYTLVDKLNTRVVNLVSNLKFELKARRATMVKLFGVLLKVIRTFSEDTMFGQAIVLEFKFLILSVS